MPHDLDLPVKRNKTQIIFLDFVSVCVFFPEVRCQGETLRGLI